MASTVEGDRARGKWRPARIAVGAALIVALGLIGFAGLRDALQNSDARTALADYLADVRQGNYAGAYGRLCSDVLPGYSVKDHEEFLQAQPGFVSFELDNATTATSGGDGTVITFSVHFTDANGRTSVTRMSVDLEDAGPRVCDGPGSRLNQ